MNRNILTVALTAILATLGGVRADDADATPKGKAQTTCPVMGGKINKQLYADVEGKRVYVCCKGCIGVIKQNPDKYLKKLADEGVAVATLQTNCPVMGGKVNPGVHSDAACEQVSCCRSGTGAAKQDPNLKKLEADGVVAAALQTTCPVMGGKVNRGLYADVEGKRVYVCCRGCIGVIKQNPDKYLKKLADQGVVVEDVPPAKEQ